MHCCNGSTSWTSVAFVRQRFSVCDAQCKYTAVGHLYAILLTRHSCICVVALADEVGFIKTCSIQNTQQLSCKTSTGQVRHHLK